MKKTDRDDGKHAADLDQLIAEITTDAHGDDEQLWAFLQAFEDGVPVRCDAFVIGEPVSIVAFDYDGNQRRGLVARCRREGGSEHVVAASEVVLAPQSSGGQFLAAYRKWLGLDPLPEQAVAPTGRKRRHKVAAADLDLGNPIELIVLSIKDRAARCRPPGSDRVTSLRASRLWDIVPGEVAMVKPRKQWSYAGHPYLSGEIQSARLEVAALGLVPLELEDRGLWTPDEHYWGKEDEPIEEWARPIIARGPRRAFEMEQIVPGRDPDDFDSDPICEANDLKDAGDGADAYQILMELCQADLRCLDAHAHLGSFVFDHRPFLRCLHGLGLCLWRLSRFQEAERVFGRMLWFNPSDNQGVRFLIDEVRAKTAWEDREEPRWSFAMVYARSRTIARREALLLIATLAMFALWLVGIAARALDWHRHFQANTEQRRHVLSAIFLGREVHRDTCYRLTEDIIELASDVLRLSIVELPDCR